MKNQQDTAPARKPGATPRRKSSTKRWIIGGVILLVALGGLARMRRGPGEQVIPVTTEKAIVKTITQVVTATGKVQPETEVKIAPEVSGEITELPFREGASVRQGDLLLRIKPDNYQFQVEQQEASLAAARAAETESQARLVKARADFNRSNELYQSGLVSESEYAAAVATLQSAEASLESAQANIRRAEGSLKQAEEQLAKTVIYSPIDGTISSLTNRVGERVAGTGQYGGAEVMRVADLDHMEVRVKVNENDIVNVRAGNQVNISIDAFGSRVFRGEVTEISNSAVAAAQGSNDVTNFEVKIAIRDRDAGLRPGMSATADIETQTVENVVAVPIQSVTVRAGDLTSAELQAQAAEEEMGRTGNELDAETERELARRNRDQLLEVVFVRNGDTVRMVPVETGIADLTHIQVRLGLDAGAEVISGSYAAISRQLKDGSRIVVEMDEPARN